MEDGRKPNVANSNIVLNRDVKASKLMELTQDFHGDVVVNKKLIVDKNLILNCNLYVIGAITYKSKIHEYDIIVNGDVYCYDEIDCHYTEVSGQLHCEGSIYTNNDIKVGEDFICFGKINAFNHKIIVAGDLECFGIEAKRVEYLGNVHVEGPVSLAEGMKRGY